MGFPTAYPPFSGRRGDTCAGPHTSVPLKRRSPKIEVFPRRAFSLVVLDEAQRIKNSDLGIGAKLNT